MRLRAAEII